MRRIFDPTAAASLPAVPTLAGVDGFFTGGNPTGGVPATRVRAWWLNMVQEELIALLTAAGITPNVASNAQVLAALQAMFAPGSAIFLANGSWTAPPGITKVRARVWGGGGSGGTTQNAGSMGGGGGGGEYRQGPIVVVPGTVYPITVGLGGAANGTAGGNGNNGGLSSFASFITAMPGSYGAGITGAATGVGGTGGTGGAGGNLAIPGTGGGLGYPMGGSAYAGGTGGGAHCSSNAAISAGTGATNGSVGVFPGGGGNGGAVGGSGGAGQPGLVMLEW